jgi:hypothetical protein
LKSIVAGEKEMFALAVWARLAPGKANIANGNSQRNRAARQDR